MIGEYSGFIISFLNIKYLTNLPMILCMCDFTTTTATATTTTTTTTTITTTTTTNTNTRLYCSSYSGTTDAATSNTTTTTTWLTPTTTTSTILLLLLLLLILLLYTKRLQNPTILHIMCFVRSFSDSAKFVTILSIVALQMVSTGGQHPSGAGAQPGAPNQPETNQATTGRDKLPPKSL